MDAWRYCEELTVREAALLIVGVDPASETGTYCDSWKPHERPSGYDAISAALRRAVISRSLAARIVHDASPRFIGGIDVLASQEGVDGHLYEFVDWNGQPFAVRVEPNWSKATVAVDDLRTWLAKGGLRPAFFFPEGSVAAAQDAPDTPDYLDPKNARFAPKLAAAVRAWQSIKDVPGRTPKQSLEAWLLANAAKLGLCGKDGKPTQKGIDQCAAVANWRPGGGAPATPGK